MDNNKIKVDLIEFVDFSNDERSNSVAVLKQDVAMLADLKLNVVALLGKKIATMGEVNSYEVGDILEVERMPGHNVDIYIGSEKIATGEIVVAENNFGISISEIFTRNGEFLKNVRKNGETE